MIYEKCPRCELNYKSSDEKILLRVYERIGG